ncbi:hypothetical protein [Paenibacillus gansuensis]|uniref:Uncharacterized protein n=1 Tax=Paenibacillus gansuensis TaxID=306542 RepID=A0ABW5PEZ3_9BACL
MVREFWRNERGMAEMVSLLIVLGVFLFISLSMVGFLTFLMRQEKLETLHHRALVMSTHEGYITPSILQDTKNKLTQIGFPPVDIGGVSYPSFAGSTILKVTREDADPSVKVVIKYPATFLQKMAGLLGGNKTETQGYFLIQGVGRSEALE